MEPGPPTLPGIPGTLEPLPQVPPSLIATPSSRSKRREKRRAGNESEEDMMSATGVSVGRSGGIMYRVWLVFCEREPEYEVRD
jgi:hypothetical protein